MGPKNGEQKRTGTQKIYRTLGKTGIKLPVITMGVMNSDNPALMRAYIYVYGDRNKRSPGSDPFPESSPSGM
jgi:hypothetical protein